ncbi:MAG: hypothetical protein P9F19_13540 [Candidatus Contendobacter sp.]|nr:hypothetical protein [Candidatus Contendobacter sp.]MDG4558394.1 hypothetical protein [Candidatus Contendobacter sp.]
MKTKWWAGLMAALLLGPTVVWAQRYGGDVEVEVVSDRSRTLPQYPVREERGGVYKAYLEAARGRNYSIQIRNRTNQRVGVVIAVDGRNIISGDRSDLRPDERMYVLGPYQQESYEGWRTGKNRVNRFYFTEAGDSYSGAWGDYSAMGVIAVAAFRESTRIQPQPWSQEGPGYSDQRGLRRAPSSAESAAPRAAPAEPGTGYGEREWSPSRRVEFDPERRPFAQVFLKYAWRETLCRQGVVNCDEGRRPPRNRLWNEDDRYAPPPPREEREEWR